MWEGRLKKEKYAGWIRVVWPPKWWGHKCRADNVHGSNRMTGRYDVPASVTLHAVPNYYRAGLSRVAFETVQCDHERYRSPAKKLDESAGGVPSKRATLDTLIEEDLFWKQARDAANMTGEALAGTQLLVSAVGHDVPASKRMFCRCFAHLLTRWRRSKANRMILIG